MKSTLLVVFAILLLAMPAVIYAQQPPGNPTAGKRTVTGKITDDKGEPLENVTVTQRGT